MICEIRKKFIFIVMASMFIIFFVLIFTINAFNIINQTNNISNMMNILIENNGILPTPQMQNSQKPPQKYNFFGKFNPEAPFMLRYCTVYLDSYKNITKVSTDKIAALSSENAQKYTNEIISIGKQSGYIHGYRFSITQNDNGYLIIFLDTSVERQNIISILLISCGIGILSYLLVFILVVFFSTTAIKPIAESYEKQKQFIADVSHELKTPLTVISANSEIISMMFGKNEWCKAIDKQTEKMRNLISKMIMLAKMDAQAPIEKESFVISDAVFDTASALEPLARRTGKDFSMNIQPNITYIGNEGEIRQCISVLLDNAIKYCDENGKILLRLYKDKHIHLKISNTYKNADTLEYDKLFNRFYRADSMRAKKNSYGLGLSIAKSIIQHHNGKICASSDKNEYVVFSVTL